MLHERDPKKRKVVIRDRSGAIRWHELWRGNQRIAGRDERLSGTQDLYNGPGMRPYHAKKLPDRWVYNLAFRPDVGEIYFSEFERQFGEAQGAVDVVIEPHVKGKASPNKQWGLERWRRLAELLRAEGMRPVQLGPPGTQVLPGVQLIHTPTFRMAAAVLWRARAAVLPEGGLHHAAAALGVPAVVIFGGFTPIELTGYATHRNLGASLGDACGMRVPCKHCEAIMAAITPERVFDELRSVLNG